MKEEIVKAYDIVIEQLRNADSKANLFIVLITAFLSYLGTIQIVDDVSNYNGTLILLWFLIAPLILLIVSLLPIYQTNFISFKKRKKISNVNIFYWESISNVESDSDFIDLFINQYNIPKLSEAEKYLLIQLKINSNILSRKAFIHGIAFYILGQILIFFIISLVYYVNFLNQIILLIIFFVILEVLYYFFLFGKKSV